MVNKTTTLRTTPRKITNFLNRRHCRPSLIDNTTILTSPRNSHVLTPTSFLPPAASHRASPHRNSMPNPAYLVVPDSQGTSRNLSEPYTKTIQTTDSENIRLKSETRPVTSSYQDETSASSMPIQRIKLRGQCIAPTLQSNLRKVRGV